MAEQRDYKSGNDPNSKPDERTSIWQRIKPVRPEKPSFEFTEGIRGEALSPDEREKYDTLTRELDGFSVSGFQLSVLRRIKAVQASPYRVATAANRHRFWAGGLVFASIVGAVGAYQHSLASEQAAVREEEISKTVTAQGYPTPDKILIDRGWLGLGMVGVSSAEIVFNNCDDTSKVVSEVEDRGYTATRHGRKVSHTILYVPDVPLEQFEPDIDCWHDRTDRSLRSITEQTNPTYIGPPTQTGTTLDQ